MVIDDVDNKNNTDDDDLFTGIMTTVDQVQVMGSILYWCDELKYN